MDCSHGQWRWLIGPVLLLSQLLCITHVHAQAQPFLRGFDDPPELNGDEALSRRLPRDPLMESYQKQGQQFLELGNVTEGLETLQQVLDDSPDFFLDGVDPTSQSMLETVKRDILAHRKEYERLYGTNAAQQLTAARDAGSLEELMALYRRFSMTDAGAEGMQLLANLLQDRGEWGAAARVLETYAEHPVAKESGKAVLRAAQLYAMHRQLRRAEKLLKDKQSLFPGESLTTLIAELRTLAEEATTQSKLYDWRTPLAGLDQRGIVSFAPLSDQAAWTKDTIDAWDFGLLPKDVQENLLEQTLDFARSFERRMHATNERTVFPAATPLIVDKLVIVRGVGTIKAYHLETGELAWVTDAAIEPTFKYLAIDTTSPSEVRNPGREEMQELFFALRDWRDQTMSSISSDGKRVYAISGCQLVGSMNRQLLVQNVAEHPLLVARHNQLCAYEIAGDGRWLWSIGSPEFRLEDFENEAAQEIFFLGAPLAWGDQLFVLGEERGQTQLFEIDPQTGDILWSLGLLNPNLDVLLADDRRMSGIIPSMGGGLLYCLTGEGVITAVDPVRRTLVWSHQYYEPSDYENPRVLRAFATRIPNRTTRETIDEQLNEGRWFDTRVIVSGDVLVVTPPDDGNLLCLDALTGAHLWDIPNAAAQAVYVPGVFEEQVIVVSRSDVTAYALADGTSSWSHPVPIPRPSGRGVLMGHQLLQPLSTGEVAVIDLTKGRLLSRFPAPQDVIVGNLAAAHGYLVTQTGTQVMSFRSRTAIEEQLATLNKSQSAEFFALRGETQLQVGEISAGLADLRKAVEMQESSRSKHVLSWALLDGLRTDFKQYESEVQDVESFLVSPQQRLQYLMTYASGLQEAGQHEQALSRYIALLNLLPTRAGMRDLSGQWSIENQAWVFARIRELLDELSTAPNLPNLQRDFGNSIVQLPDPLLLRTMAALPLEWVDQPVVREQLPVMIQRILEKAEVVELRALEAALLKLQQSPVAQSQAMATGGLAATALVVKDGETAQSYLAQLERDFAKTPITADKTGLAWSTELRESGSELLLAVPVWPEQVDVSTNGSRFPASDRYPIPHLGPMSQALSGWTFMLDEMGSTLELQDAHGRRRARIPTGLANVRQQMGPTLPRYVQTYGHAALVVLTDRFLLLNVLPDGQLQLVANQSLVLNEDSPYANRGFIFPGQRPLQGMRNLIARTAMNTFAGNVGPLTSGFLCYGMGSDLVAVDPSSFRELWRRHDVAQGSEILADEEYVITRSPMTKKLTIFRATDGKLLNERTIPDDVLMNSRDWRNAEWGRYLPVQRHPEPESSPEVLTWGLYDPVHDDYVWTREFPANTIWAPVRGQNLAFLLPDHRLQFVSGLTGDILAETKLPLENGAGKMSVISFDDQHILVLEKHVSKLSTINFDSHTDVLSPPLDGVVVALTVKQGVQPAKGEPAVLPEEEFKVVWTRKLDNMSFPRFLPSQWPVIYFANSFGRDFELVMLNRRTGEVILEDRWDNEQSRIGWIGSTQPLTMKFRFAREMIELTWTEKLDQPAGKPAPKQEQPSKSSETKENLPPPQEESNTKSDS